MNRKEILQLINQKFTYYKINIMTSGTVGLPESLYLEPNITLDISNEFARPTNIGFGDMNFCISGSFNTVIYLIEIPYENLNGIFEYDMSEGVLFVRKYEEQDIDLEVKEPKVFN